MSSLELCTEILNFTTPLKVQMDSLQKWTILHFKLVLQSFFKAKSIVSYKITIQYQLYMVMIFMKAGPGEHLKRDTLTKLTNNKTLSAASDVWCFMSCVLMFPCFIISYVIGVALNVPLSNHTNKHSCWMCCPKNCLISFLERKHTSSQ